MKHQLRTITLLLFLMVLLPFVGCGKGRTIPGLVRCEGTVLWNGEPVAGAHVTFSPKSSNGRDAFGVTGADGKFKVTTLDTDDGILPDEYVVTVAKMTETRELPDTRKNPDAPREGIGAPKIERERYTVTYYIPQIYSNKETSGLTATVGTKGTRDLVFELVGEIEK